MSKWMALRAWVKQNLGWIWYPLTLIGVFLGARAILKSQSNRIGNLKDALAAEKARRQITAGEERVKMLGQQIVQTQLEIDLHKDNVQESKKRVVAIESQTKVEDLTNDEEVAERFNKLQL